MRHFLRTGHGNAKEHGTSVVVEGIPHDELPEGVPAPARMERPEDRAQDGRFAPGNALAAAGGKEKARRRKAKTILRIREVPSGAPFRPYSVAGDDYAAARIRELSQKVGGGRIGPGVAAMVSRAALQHAWGLYFSDRAAETGDPKDVQTASRLFNDARQNELAAHSLAALEAEGADEGEGWNLAPEGDDE